MSADARPLGRYQDVAANDAELVEVRLLNLPLAVLVASREHHDELLREFRLMALSDSVPDEAAPARLLELVQLLGVQYAGAAARPNEIIDDALDRGEASIDVTYLVPPGVGAGAGALDALMAEADEFCRSEQLLTLARSPLMVEFAAWYLRSFVDQLAGEPAEPWAGPLAP